MVERVADDAYGHSLLLRTDRPGPGLVEVAAREPALEAWMAARFPAAPGPGRG